MRTVVIEMRVGGFEELSPELQKKAIDYFRHSDFPPYDPDFIIDNFCDEMGKIGLYVTSDNVHFSGFYCQGDGSSFYGKVENLMLFINDEIDNYRESFNTNKEFYTFKRWVKHVSEKCDYNIEIEETRNRNSVYANLELYTYAFNGYVKNVCEEQEKKFFPILEHIIEEKAKSLNDNLYKELEQEYEYLMSDEYIKEFIKINEYEFNLYTGEIF